jgi:hypothetical protein
MNSRLLCGEETKNQAIEAPVAAILAAALPRAAADKTPQGSGYPPCLPHSKRLMRMSPADAIQQYGHDLQCLNFRPHRGARRARARRVYMGALAAIFRVCSAPTWWQ